MSETNQATILSWLGQKLVEAEKTLKTRDLMAHEWREGDDTEWAAAAALHPSTAALHPSTAGRIAEAERQDLIAVKCRHELEMLKKTFSAIIRIASLEAELAKAKASTEKIQADCDRLQAQCDGLTDIISSEDKNWRLRLEYREIRQSLSRAKAMRNVCKAAAQMEKAAMDDKGFLAPDSARLNFNYLPAMKDLRNALARLRELEGGK